MDFAETKIVQEIELWPRPTIEGDQWVTSFKLAFSRDGVDFRFKFTPNGRERVFQGPGNSVDIARVAIDPTEARFVRLYPQTYVGHMAVIWEIYTCV